MMRHILLVAAREFRQIAATRSFWLTLLILPIAMVAGGVSSSFLNRSEAKQIMIIDPAGRSADAIRAKFEIDEQRRVVTALSRYAKKYDFDRLHPGAAWARQDRLLSDREIAAFVEAGGGGSAPGDDEEGIWTRNP